MPIADVRSLEALLRELGGDHPHRRGGGGIATPDRPHPARPDPTPDQLDKYAGQLNNLSVRLGELGRREEGLAAVEEAVTVYRRLAEANPAVYLPDLAMS